MKILYQVEENCHNDGKLQQGYSNYSYDNIIR